MAVSDRLKQELAWRKAKSDVLWCAGQWWIQHPQGARRWDLYPAQIEILQDWESGNDYLHLKARQVGFSTSVAFFAWRKAYFNEGVKILLLSKGERESRLLLDKIKFGYERLPEWLRDRGPKVGSWTQSEIKFSNGSEVMSLPSASDPARGFTGALIVVDEWAFLPNADEAWASIRPTADVGGQIIGLSTANGVGNMFHTLWVNATNGIGSFTPKFYGWDTAQHRDEAWYERQKEDLLPWQLHQEYPSDPEEAFIKSGAAVFDLNRLRETKTNPGTRYRLFVPSQSGVRWEKRDDGEVEVWQTPKPNTAYVIGADVAEGLGYGDFSSAHVMELATRNVVATWHGRVDPDLFGLELYGLGTMYNSALLCVEANNHGLTTIAQLRQWAYPRLWRRHSTNSVNRGALSEYGFKTTRSTKPVVIDKLAAWLREPNRELPCPATVAELTSYVRAGNGSMGGSPHDDRVMSLAFCVYMLGFAFQPEYEQVIDDTWTVDWWARQADQLRQSNETTGIRPLRSGQ